MDNEHDFFTCFEILDETEDASQTSRKKLKKTEKICLDMWGSCTPQNFLKKMRKTACLKPLHVDLLRQMLEVCSAAGVAAFVYAGTALGVYREGGQMIPHDYDSDFACLEYSSYEGSLSRIANYCLQHNVLVSGVDGLHSMNQIETKLTSSNISVYLGNSLDNPMQWLFFDGSEVKERPFNGCGSKTAKFYFTNAGLAEATKRLKTKLNPAQITALQYDLSNIHVDLFTLSPHPHFPKEAFRVNWHRNGMYDSLGKLFPRQFILPLQKSTFECLSILIPADLKGYLTIEYGYLGVDAMYDRTQQCYIKIPIEMQSKFPAAYFRYISSKTNGENAA